MGYLYELGGVRGGEVMSGGGRSFSGGNMESRPWLWASRKESKESSYSGCEGTLKSIVKVFEGRGGGGCWLSSKTLSISSISTLLSRIQGSKEHTT